MNCFKGLTCFTKQLKCNTCVLGRLENGVLVAKNDIFLSSLAQRGYKAATSLVQAGYTIAHPQKILNSARDTPWKIKLPFGLSRSTLGPEKCAMSTSFRHIHGRNSDPDLSRGFLLQLWVEDNKRLISEENRKRKIRKHLHNDVTRVGSQSSFEVPHGSFEELKPPLEQPPTSQPVTGFLKPTSSEEVRFQNLSFFLISNKYRYNFFAYLCFSLNVLSYLGSGCSSSCKIQSPDHKGYRMGKSYCWF